MTAMTASQEMETAQREKDSITELETIIATYKAAKTAYRSLYADFSEYCKRTDTDNTERNRFKNEFYLANRRMIGIRQEMKEAAQNVLDSLILN